MPLKEVWREGLPEALEGAGKVTGWFFPANLAKIAASSPRDLRPKIDRFRFMGGLHGKIFSELGAGRAELCDFVGG